MTPKIKLFAAAAIAAASTAGTAFATTWDMPTAYPDSNFHTEYVRKFAKEIGTCTDGKLEITVHSNGSLFKGNQIKRAVQIGQAQIGEVLISASANENPIYGIDSIPFLATSYAESAKLWKASEPAISEALSKSGLHLVYSVPWPPQGFYFKKKISSVADMKGLKFRSYNKSVSRMAQLLGMDPVEIQAADLPQALSTGVASAFLSSGSTGYDIKAWEYVKYFYDTQAWLPRNVVFINNGDYDKLSKKEQGCIASVGKTISAEATKKSHDLASWYLEQFRKHGMIVVEPDKKLMGELKKVGETMTADWLKNAGKTGDAVIAKYKASLKD